MLEVEETLPSPHFINGLTQNSRSSHRWISARQSPRSEDLEMALLRRTRSVRFTTQVPTFVKRPEREVLTHSDHPDVGRQAGGPDWPKRRATIPLPILHRTWVYQALRRLTEERLYSLGEMLACLLG